MSPDRTIGGLTPRAGEQDLSRLQRRNRPAVTTPEAATDTNQTTGASQPPHVEASTVTPPAPTSPRPPASESSETDKVKATIYLDAAVRERARAAYRATGHLEDERSWSEFVEAAIAREVERRETTYNHGQPYARDNTRLAPGRPLD